jgi:hypothetical protein
MCPHLSAKNADIRILSASCLHLMLSGPLRLNSFVELSRGLFTSHDITDTETKILKALNYVVNPPTSRRFVGELVRIFGLRA